METTLNKLTITQKIAVYWLKQVDSGLLLFKLLQTLSKPFRIAFYVGLIAFTVFGMKFISIFILEYNNSLWQLLGNTLFYGVAIGISFVVTIESVLNEDVAAILEEKKAKVAEIKKNKLQRWRLRNITVFVRVSLYISFYIVCIFIIQTASYSAFIDLFATAPNTPQTHAAALEFMAAYESFFKWFTFGFFISALVLDYFVNKKRALRKLEAQNETV